jgi:RHS repeat-associated protein
MGEKFAANPVTGTGSMTIPIAVSPGRSGFAPQLSLSYDSGAGNGPFGLGWNLSLPSITRKTDKGLPQYNDADESDVFILSGAEDLVPVLKLDGAIDEIPLAGFMVRKYRPRIEGLFARIERWASQTDPTDVFWRSISKDNITTFYGKSAESRIVDPSDPQRIFSWLICQSYDDKGNAIIYKYAQENEQGVDITQANEANRTRTANRYPKRIKYGNRAPNRDANSNATDPALLPDSTWMFEVVFDYGEGHFEALQFQPGDHQFVTATLSLPNTAQWQSRLDPFSSYRSGFEARTYRLCRRALMFHHFPVELGIADCLVSSTEFTYAEAPIASCITQVIQSGYLRQPSIIKPNRYLRKSLPRIELIYSQVPTPKELTERPIQDVDAASLENLPVGLDGAAYQWVDLDGVGLSGLLTDQGDGWFYKRNTSANNLVQENGAQRTVARFATVELVAPRPAGGLHSGQPQFMDLAGDGQPDLVLMDGPVRGFYERTLDEDWEPFRPFISWPNLDIRDPNLKFIDLDGDGHTDILITEDDAFVWYLSLAEDGFGPAQRALQPWDEEKGPRLVFADAAQSIYLADLSGDGLTDLVRIRNGEVCYWPNLGYGRFGMKVTMDNAPRFDMPDLFDQKRIRLADIDGSGVTDILYLGAKGVQIYYNLSGNGWSDAQTLTNFPPIDNLTSVQAVDLLGNGTACLVWSSPLPGHARRQMRYIDLMGQKPHLLIKTANNLGAETVVQYAPSTKFYLQDKLDGKPWITKLPFPAHVVERVETYDRVSGNRFVSRYAYHHGYFDGVEREFRGFGMVEQWDTEEIGGVPAGGTSSSATNLDDASFVPPIHTKTWFHTGVFLGRDRVSNYFAGLMDAQDTGEYYREPGWGDADAKKFLLDDTVLPAGLTLDEEREACRALKGSMLRQEIYGLEGTDKAQHPYTVTEQNFTIELLQSKAGNRHAVFFTHPREALSYHYERNPHDPRVAHALTLEVDPFGNVLKSATIGYGRRQPDPKLTLEDQTKQSQLLITCVENDFTNSVIADDDYRTPLPCEARTYELTELSLPANQNRFTFNDVLNAMVAAVPLSYEQKTTAGVLQKRLIEHVRTLYRRNDLTSPLPLGQLQSLALPFESYKLAFSPGLLTEVYGGRVTNTMLEPEGGYVHSEGDANWWIPSGRVFFSATANVANSAATAPAEVAEARKHFFLPRKFTDPFGHSSAVDYDTYDLHVTKTEDAIGNTVTAVNDYRVLRPKQMTDPNGNRSEAAFDALGMVVGTAVRGKAVGPVEGDSFSTFIAHLRPQQIKDYFDAPNPRPLAINHLGTATTRIIYDLERVPACAASIARETHVSDLPPGEQTKVQLSFVYSDGFGREAQTKIQAEPVPLDPNDLASPVLDPRWVGTGAKVYNNKGKPVRQYEPFFSPAHSYGIEQHGVSSTLFYDPAERIVATLHPNHTWEKVVFDPWRQATYDMNDTVLNADGSTDPKADSDVKGFFSRLPDADYLPTWYEQRIALAADNPERVASEKTALHAQTPTVAHLDALGRTFLTVADNGKDVNGNSQKYPTRVALDIEGNQREVIDALDRVVMRYDYDLLSNRIHQASMEAGERWMLNDVTGKPIRAWDSRGHQFKTEYDSLRRPLRRFVRGSDAIRSDPRTLNKDVLFERIEYGEGQPNDVTLNLRTRVFKSYDGAGIVTNEAYDFKGNLARSSRQLAQDYKELPNWLAPVDMELDTYQSRTTFDAVNRPIQVIAPHNNQPGAKVNIIQPAYNEANLLDKVNAWLNQNAEPVTMLNPATAGLQAVTNIDYNAKGERTLIKYGNGAETSYTYDPDTFRLTNLQTLRGAERLQDLRYTYDPAGNITAIRDDAQQTIYFSNICVKPHNEYTYDAIYRLIEATGREHLGQNGAPAPASYNDVPRIRLQHPNDCQAMGRYRESYLYDAISNFLEIQHRRTDQANPGWTRAYAYNEPSLLEPTRQSNRLTNTTVGGTPETYSVSGNGYDAHGNMLRMPQLQLMQWDFKDQLQMTQRQAVNADDEEGVEHKGERTLYVYDASGQRTRKVTEFSTGQIKDERIYLGGFEIYRRHGAKPLVRETLHIMDENRRIALVETRNDVDDGTAKHLIRYQFGNHLGSASLELDNEAQIISYEEYTPYGSTSYQAVNKGIKAAAKRYRYTGKEQDEESGLYYHGARYYSPWLLRWTSCDPNGLTDSLDLFLYARNNPVGYIDADGRSAQWWVELAFRIWLALHGKKPPQPLKPGPDPDPKPKIGGEPPEPPPQPPPTDQPSSGSARQRFGPPPRDLTRESQVGQKTPTESRTRGFPPRGPRWRGDRGAVRPFNSAEPPPAPVVPTESPVAAPSLPQTTSTPTPSQETIPGTAVEPVAPTPPAPTTGGSGAGPAPRSTLPFLGRLGTALRVLNVAALIVASVGDILRITLEEHPEKLREGARIELTRPSQTGLGPDPIRLESTGYTVEKTGGKVIYRDTAGKEVSEGKARGIF